MALDVYCVAVVSETDFICEEDQGNFGLVEMTVIDGERVGVEEFARQMFCVFGYKLHQVTMMICKNEVLEKPQVADVKALFYGYRQ
jgi:hypothetical protein